jgi:hypothetical protein
VSQARKFIERNLGKNTFDANMNLLEELQNESMCITVRQTYWTWPKWLCEFEDGSTFIVRDFYD